MIHHKVRSNKQPSKTMRRMMSLPVKRQGFPHLGHPSQKYSLNWEINQAGLGWLSLGNYFGYSTVLIKKKKTRQNQTSFSMLQSAFHPNLVGLVEAFYDDHNLYLAYNYDGLAVSLSQVTTTPAVILREPDIAGICRSILSGLEYLHEDLRVGHGNIQSSNILLCPDGVVKIANIGDAMLEEGSTSFFDDREKLRDLLFALSSTTTQGGYGPQKEDPTSVLSRYGMHFAEQLVSASFSYLYEHIFLEQIGISGQDWYLIPHYLDTIMYWGVLKE